MGSVIALITGIASSYSTSASDLLLCFGVLVGFGFWFVLTKSVVTVGEYFRWGSGFWSGLIFNK